MTKTDDGILDSAVFSGGDRRTFVGACKMGVVSGCLVATIVLLCIIVVSALLSGMTAWMVWCLSCIGAGIAGGIFQQLWFNYLPTRRFTYSTRLFLFGVTYFVVLVACAYLGSWLPRENPYAWASFAIIYLGIFGVLTAVFGHALKKRGIEYKAKLDDYRRSRGLE